MSAYGSLPENNREKGQAGRLRRAKAVASHDQNPRRAKIDYSDKGEHDWKIIGAHTYRCSKCNVIKDILFDDPYYLLDVDKHQWVEPLCTWKGRKAK